MQTSAVPWNGNKLDAQRVMGLTAVCQGLDDKHRAPSALHRCLHPRRPPCLQSCRAHYLRCGAGLPLPRRAAQQKRDLLAVLLTER